MRGNRGGVPGHWQDLRNKENLKIEGDWQEVSQDSEIICGGAEN